LERLVKNSRVVLVLMLGVLTHPLIAAVVAAEPPTVAGQVVAVAGPVTVTRANVNPQPVKFRDDLYWRDVLDARKDGIARALLGGKTTVTVRELSRLELRQEATAEGVRYTAELVSGKVRTSVARMLMRPGEQVEVRTRNTVASVRGTDFIVETTERAVPARAFGLLGVRDLAQGIGESGARANETAVVTLSGVVEVWNRLGGTGRVERVGAYEAVRVIGRQDPMRFQPGTDALHGFLRGLTLPRPQQARSGDRAEAVGNKVERAALAGSAQIPGTSAPSRSAEGRTATSAGSPSPSESASPAPSTAASGSGASQGPSTQPAADSGRASASSAPSTASTSTPGGAVSSDPAPASSKTTAEGRRRGRHEPHRPLRGR